jgi:hypothetical protein
VIDTSVEDQKTKIDLWVERDRGSYSCIILNDEGGSVDLSLHAGDTWMDGFLPRGRRDLCYYRDAAQLAAKQCNAMQWRLW